MNQTEMLHQMCHEVLAEADVRAICKNRGLPNQAASSRPMLESLFLSDAGVAVAAAVLQRPDRRIRRFVRDEGWQGVRRLCGAPAPSGWLGRMRSR